MEAQIAQSSTGLGFYTDIIFSLLIVLMIILIGAFVLKKFQTSKFSKVKKIQLIDSVYVGNKEKIILVNVNNRSLLVGVTQNNITLLDNHIMTDEETEALSKSVQKSDNSQSTFQKKLVNALSSKK